MSFACLSIYYKVRGVSGGSEEGRREGGREGVGRECLPVNIL